MNLQTFNSPEEPKKKANKKPIITGATVAVVLVAAVAIEQGREDNGYSGGGAGSVDKTSDQDYRDWVSGIVNVGG